MDDKPPLKAVWSWSLDWPI